MLFGGSVWHAGIAVEAGWRVCLVASFSPLDEDAASSAFWTPKIVIIRKLT